MKDSAMKVKNAKGMDHENCFFLTMNFRTWMPMHLGERYYHVAAEAINECCKRYDCDVLGYVFMPEQVQLIVYFNREAACSDFVRDFKKICTSSVKGLMANGRNSVVFRQMKAETPGHDLKVWKARYDALTIEQEVVLETKLNYIHANPVKEALASSEYDYYWSSARWYLNQNSLSPIRLRHAASVVK